MQPRCQLLSGRLPLRGALIRSTQATRRTYATSDSAPEVVTNPLQRRKGGDLGSHLPKDVIPIDAYIPEYPYGDHKLFKQANKGLYGQQKIEFGNNVSRKTDTRTRRFWKPNVMSKSLYSVALKKRIKLRLTSRTMKIIDREGGLDEYLLKDSEHRVKELGPLGWALRWTLMRKPEVIKRIRTQAAALGIDQEIIDKQWPTRKMTEGKETTLTPQTLENLTDELELGGFAETDEPQKSEQTLAGGESDTPAPKYPKQHPRAAKEAASQYVGAMRAANRYLERGIVDSQEEGLKLAFIRVNERAEASRKSREAFKQKLEQMFTPDDLQQIRTRFNLPNISDTAARKIAYNQQKRQQIDAAGGLEAWKASIQAQHPYSKTLEQVRADYAALIAEAEGAATNTSMDRERRSFLHTAIRQAGRAIEATRLGGADAYVQLVFPRLAKEKEMEKGKDAWADLVAASNASSQTQPRV